MRVGIAATLLIASAVAAAVTASNREDGLLTSPSIFPTSRRLVFTKIPYGIGHTADPSPPASPRPAALRWRVRRVRRWLSQLPRVSLGRELRRHRAAGLHHVSARVLRRQPRRGGDERERGWGCELVVCSCSSSSFFFFILRNGGGGGRGGSARGCAWCGDGRCGGDGCPGGGVVIAFGSEAIVCRWKIRCVQSKGSIGLLQLGGC